MKNYLPLIVGLLLVAGVSLATGIELKSPNSATAGASPAAYTGTAPIVVTGGGSDGGTIACTAAGAGVSGCLTDSAGQLVVDAGFVCTSTDPSSFAGPVRVDGVTSLATLDAGPALFSGAVTIGGGNPFTTDGGAAVGMITIGPLVASGGSGLTAGASLKCGSMSATNTSCWNQATPSTSNYALTASATATYLNATTTTGIAVANGVIAQATAGVFDVLGVIKSGTGYIIRPTNPVIASGWGQLASIAASGTFVMRVTTGVADGGALNNSTGVLTFPAAVTKWNCRCDNLTSAAVWCKQTLATDTTTGVSFAGYTVGTSTPAAWGDNDVLSITCGGH